MIVSIAAGIIAFRSLGRAEDPAFTIRTMVVTAAWPGATVEETLLQVTERIERKLQETPHLDKLRSYTTAGATTIFVDLEGATPPAKIADLWYQVRKNIGDIRGTLPLGVVGPAFNDDFGDTYGIIFGFTAEVRISANVTADFGIVTDSAGWELRGVDCRVSYQSWSSPGSRMVGFGDAFLSDSPVSVIR